MKGLRAHTNNLKVSVLWTPSQAQNHSKTITASDSPSSRTLEFGSYGSETVSFRLNKTTQWLTNSSGLQTEWWHGDQKYFSTDQNVIDGSPGIQHHSPYEVHGYSVKEELSGLQTAVAYKQNGGTVIRNISPLTKMLLMAAREYNIIVHMRFMDTLSRKNKLVST